MKVFMQHSIQSAGPIKVFYTSPLGRPVHPDTNSTSLPSAQRLFTHIFPPLSTSRYSLIQLGEPRHRGAKENAQASKQQQRALEPGLSQSRPAYYRGGSVFMWCYRGNAGYQSVNMGGEEWASCRNERRYRWKRNNRELSLKARGQLGGVKGRDWGKETSGKERTWLQIALAGAFPVNSNNIFSKSLEIRRII